MITMEEKDEVAKLAREDGKRFYGVVEGMYRFMIMANWVTAAAGGLLGLGCLIKGMSDEYGGTGTMVAGVVVLVVTAFACATNYAVAVLTTHGAKVLVHILFSNLAIMEEKQS
jgi:hypothetical protein